MGTHPIFESDFDCLTEKLENEGRYPCRWVWHQIAPVDAGMSQAVGRVLQQANDASSNRGPCTGRCQSYHFGSQLHVGPAPRATWPPRKTSWHYNLILTRRSTNGHGRSACTGTQSDYGRKQWGAVLRHECRCHCRLSLQTDARLS